MSVKPGRATEDDGGAPTDAQALTIVIPATVARPGLDLCLAAVRAAASEGDQIIVVREPPGSSPAHARNIGVTAARTDVVVFVDADIVVHADALARIRARFASDPSLHALYGAYDDRPGGGTVSVFRNLLHHHIHTSSAGESDTFWAGIGAVRRASFLRAQGFDAERYPRPMLEDVEFGIRLRRAGLRIVLDPTIQGTHLKRWTLWTMVRSDLRDRGIPWTRVLITYRRLPATLNLGWRHRVSALSVGVGIAASAQRRWWRAAISLGLLIGLNRRFYALLRRRLGTLRLPLGIALHVLHHTCSLVAVPLGAVEHMWRRRMPRPLADGDVEMTSDSPARR